MCTGYGWMHDCARGTKAWRYPIYLICRHVRPDDAVGLIQNFTTQLASSCIALDLLIRSNQNVVLLVASHLYHWEARACPLREWHPFGHCPLRCYPAHGFLRSSTILSITSVMPQCTVLCLGGCLCNVHCNPPSMRFKSEWRILEPHKR
jgi:hypothetical protein